MEDDGKRCVHACVVSQIKALNKTFWELKSKHTFSLVEALLCNLNVSFEDLLVDNKPHSLPLPELWILCCDFVYPVMFGLCSPAVTVIVIDSNPVNQNNTQKLREVCDSREQSIEKCQ